MIQPAQEYPAPEGRKVYGLPFGPPTVLVAPKPDAPVGNAVRLDLAGLPTVRSSNPNAWTIAWRGQP